jgi:hypothetical protein
MIRMASHHDPKYIVISLIAIIPTYCYVYYVGDSNSSQYVLISIMFDGLKPRSVYIQHVNCIDFFS